MSDVAWLLDTGKPLIIGAEWRKKAEQLRALPMWFYTPPPAVQRYLEALRAAPFHSDPPKATGKLWEAVKKHFQRDLVAFVWHVSWHEDRDPPNKRNRANLTPGQLILVWRTMQLIHEKKAVRLDLLKQRQGGFSWVFTQIVLWIITTKKNVGAVVAAHEKDAAASIFGYLKRGRELMPKEIRPTKEYDTRHQLTLREGEDEREKGNEGQNSGAVVLTVGKPFPASGFPIQVVIASEVGKWHKTGADPAVAYGSLVNAVQKLPGTFIAKESTAHGSGTFWHKEWLDAMKMGASGWNGATPIFIPWFFDPRCVGVVPPGFVVGTAPQDAYGDEKTMMERHDLTLENLQWRRDKIDDQPPETVGYSKLDWFAQEHPSTQEEAWLFAGGLWLHRSVVAVMEKRLAGEMNLGLLKTVFTGDLVPGRAELGYDTKRLAINEQANNWLRRRTGGPFSVFRWPDRACDYIVGGDLAEGISTGDHSCLKVYQRIGYEHEGLMPMRLAAEWFGHIDEGSISEILWRLGWFYSTGHADSRIPAMLAWERNFAGRNIARYLRYIFGYHYTEQSATIARDAYPMNRMFRRFDPSSVKGTPDLSFGIATTAQNKSAMMGEWYRAAKDGEVQLTGEDLLEVGAVSKDDNGRIETKGKDRLMASVMATWGAMFTPMVNGIREQAAKQNHKKWTVGWGAQSARDAERRRESAEDDP